MSISLHDLKVGDTLYCARRRGSHVKDVASYLIVEIVLGENFDTSKARVSVNGQPPQFLSFKRLARLRREKPQLVINANGDQRVATDRRLRRGWTPIF